jgi:citrate lyase subunit beta/citryl-CoA lyase
VTAEAFGPSLLTRAAAARSLLFVPGDRPDRFAKATSSGADLVLLDLEDAVAAERKDVAREHVVEALATGHPYAVRINALDTPFVRDDVEALSDERCVVMVPKAESAERMRDLAAQLRPGSALLALVETARGVLSAASLAAAPNVLRLALGTFDLATELFIASDDRDALASARGHLVLASASAGLAGPIDGVTGNIRDETTLRDDLQFARRLGFTGKLCVHPSQVAVVNDLLQPAAAQVAWAQRVLQADADARAAGSAVATADGQLVDKPVVDLARRIQAQHEMWR